jgi:hypothetical protein
MRSSTNLSRLVSNVLRAVSKKGYNSSFGTAPSSLVEFGAGELDEPEMRHMIRQFSGLLWTQEATDALKRCGLWESDEIGMVAAGMQSLDRFGYGECSSLSFAVLAELIKSPFYKDRTLTVSEFGIGSEPFEEFLEKKGKEITRAPDHSCLLITNSSESLIVDPFFSVTCHPKEYGHQDQILEYYSMTLGLDLDETKKMMKDIVGKFEVNRFPENLTSDKLDMLRSVALRNTDPDPKTLEILEKSAEVVLEKVTLPKPELEVLVFGLTGNLRHFQDPSPNPSFPFVYSRDSSNSKFR